VSDARNPTTLLYLAGGAIAATAGGLYFFSLRAEPTVAPAPPPAASSLVSPDARPTVDEGLSTAPAVPSRGADKPPAPPMLPGVAAMATRPVVKPADQTDAARAALTALLPELQACYRDTFGAEGPKGRLFLHAKVADELGPNPAVHLKGLGDNDLMDCAREVASDVRYPGVADGTSVFWPIALAADGTPSL